MNMRPYIRKVAFLGLGVFGLACVAITIAGLIDDVVRSDVALVLGTKVELDGKPGVAMKVRCDRAVELFQDGMVTYVIASGGTGVEGYDEAIVMRDYLVGQGVPSSAIITDGQGINTYASARFTRDFLRQKGLKSVIAVSQYYHVPRAELALEQFGIEEVHGAHGRYFGWRDLYAIPREAAGWVAYLFKSYE